MPKTRGMTFIEMMIALTIMSILLTVAYPLYDRQIQRSRRSDAKTALYLIALAQEKYYTAHGSYAVELNKLDIPPILQTGYSAQRDYTLTMTQDANQQQFTVTATTSGKQVNDLSCQNFSINQLGIKTAHHQNGELNTHCW